ncbi:MAG: prenyltransferase/squalene oxidase repeat-containing protein, partial [Rhodospirillales bacterium]|nr:prenyltransferase/squalene oxidase repeat-containing protein [Rhodospirillales bacterium]
SDVTARCVGFLSQVNQDKNSANIKRGISFLKSEQEEDGSWFGRWGTNYIYGTWSVLCALNAAKEDMAQPYIRKAVDWLKARQRDDGGWGEDCASYWEHRKNTVKDSMPSQTAWALLALIAAGEIQSAEVARGIQYLLDQFDKTDGWEDTFFNAVGFPRVFYLKYHGYSDYFPLMALARYSRLKKSNFLLPEYGL